MSLDFINNYDKKKPLYLNVGFVGPHPPYWTVNDYDKYSPDEVQAPKMVIDEKQIKKVKKQRAIYNSHSDVKILCRVIMTSKGKSYQK